MLTPNFLVRLITACVAVFLLIQASSREGLQRERGDRTGRQTVVGVVLTRGEHPHATGEVANDLVKNLWIHTLLLYSKERSHTLFIVEICIFTCA